MGGTSKAKAESNAFRSERNKRLRAEAPPGKCYICLDDLPKRAKGERGGVRVLCKDEDCVRRSTWITCEYQGCNERAPLVVNGRLRCEKCRDLDGPNKDGPPGKSVSVPISVPSRPTPVRKPRRSSPPPVDASEEDLPPTPEPKTKPPPARNLDVVKREAAMRRYEKDQRDKILQRIRDAKNAVEKARKELADHDDSVLEARRTRALEFVNSYFVQNGA